ncbi:MAG: hypothetical protein ACJAYU_001115 [Bradymonadia bacterium]
MKKWTQWLSARDIERADPVETERLSAMFERSRPAWFRPDAAIDASLEGVDTFLFESWITSVATRLRAELVSATALESASRVARFVRSAVVIRRIPERASSDSLSESRFMRRRYARLLFGYTNCEGGSYLAYRLLRKVGGNCTLAEAHAIHSHTAVVFWADEQWAFLDVMSPVPIYSLKDFAPSDALGNPTLARYRPMDRVPSHESLEYPVQLLVEHGLYPAELLRKMQCLRRNPKHRPPALRIRKARREIIHGPGIASTAFLRDLLDVRHDHVWDGAVDRRRYRELITRHELSGFEQALMERLAEGEDGIERA